jgi:hypothetical protein
VAVAVATHIWQAKVDLVVRSGAITVAPLTMAVTTARSLGAAMFVATKGMSDGLVRRCRRHLLMRRSRQRKRPIVGVRLVSASPVRIPGAHRLQIFGLSVKEESSAQIRSVVRIGIRRSGSIRSKLKVVVKVGRTVKVAKVARKVKVAAVIKVPLQ